MLINFIALIISFSISFTIHFKIFTDWCFSFKADLKNQLISFTILWIIVYRITLFCINFKEMVK